MKIVMITCGMGKGGKERQIVALLKGICTKGYSVDLVILTEVISYNEILQLPVKIHKFNKKFAFDVGLVKRLRCLIGDIKPNVIHAWDSAAVIHSLPISKFLRIPFINGMIRSAPTSTGFPTKEWFYKKVLMSRKNALVANSYAGLRSYDKSNEGIVIYNGYDQDRVVTKLKASKISPETNDIKIAMVAAFTRKKDFETYLNAAIYLLERNVKAVFYAIGDGPLLRKCKEKYRKKNIIFLGERNDIDSIIPLIDIGVLTCIASWRGEGVPNSLIEFMANAKPVIGTNSGGTKELIQDGQSGYIIAEGDVKALVRKLQNLIKNPNLRERLGANAEVVVKEKFTYKTMVKEYELLYQKEIQKNRLHV